jgi:osmoprotectant transport system permease protein
MKRAGTLCCYVLLGLCMGFSLSARAGEATLQIGSKRFTESYVLGEILKQTAMAHGPVQHQQGLGNTAIVLAALKAGRIDLYPEYLGTIDQEILKHSTPTSLETIRAELARLGLGVAVPLGFNNSYALAVSGNAPPDIQSLADLARYPGQRLGLSHEFLGRLDGWPGLAQRYQLPHKPAGLDHGLAFQALIAGQVDVIDVYSTDAKIGKLGLRVLTDTANYFARYDAVLLYRLDVPQRFPAAWAAIRQLEGQIDNARMIALNAAVELQGQSFSEVAKTFLQTPVPGSLTQALPGSELRQSFTDKLLGESFWRLTRQHILLVLVSMLVACLIGIPLGVLAAFVPTLQQSIMAIVGILQTVPSLAMLAFLIAMLGQIGTLPALITLLLYALLPIVRSTCTGLQQVPAGLRMAALALGLSPKDRLLLIDLPLARPVILSGLKTAAVMSVGTATLAAFVGAGGYGERIAIGLATNDNAMLLAGALPAAVLALLTQGLFEVMEKRWITRP